MEYNIRHAVETDDDNLLECARNAFLESPYVTLQEFSPSRVRSTIAFLRGLGNDSAIILVAEDKDKKIIGVFAAMVSFTTMGLDPVAMEVLWWVSPSARKSRLSITLVKAFEFWAGKLGLNRLVLGSMQNEHADSINKFYTKQGYSWTERTYFKELNNGRSN